MSLTDAIEAYQKSKVDKDSAFQELYRIQHFKKNKSRIDHLEKELDSQKDVRSLVDSSHVLSLEQRDVLVKGNVRLN